MGNQGNGLADQLFKAAANRGQRGASIYKETKIP